MTTGQQGMDHNQVLEDFLREASADPDAFDKTLKDMIETLKTITEQGKEYQNVKQTLSSIFARFMPLVPASVEEGCRRKLGVNPCHPLDAMFADYCLFYGSEGEKSLIAKFLDMHASRLSREEISILQDLTMAEFSVLEVEGILIEGALAVFDLFFGEHMVVFDKGLSTSVTPGMLIIGHIVQSSGVVFTTETRIAISSGTPCARSIRKEIANAKKTRKFYNQEAYCRRILQLAYQNITDSHFSNMSRLTHFS